MAQTRTTSSRIQQHTIHSIQFYYSPVNVMLVPHPCQVAQTICECCTHSPLGLRERPLSCSFYWKKVPISHTYLRTLHPFVNHCNEVNEQYHGGTSSITRRDVNQKSSIICSVQMINLNVVFSCGVWLKLATHPRSLHNFTQPASSRYAIWWRYNRDTLCLGLLVNSEEIIMINEPFVINEPSCKGSVTQDVWWKVDKALTSRNDANKDHKFTNITSIKR